MKTRNLSIMFTDIKGFTSRTSGSTRKDVADLIKVHERLLVPVFLYFDGVIVKTIGDAFLVYFESPTDAVLCGVTIQEVLRRHNKAVLEDEQLEVRVAINVGDVELKENDIIGEDEHIFIVCVSILSSGIQYSPTLEKSRKILHKYYPKKAHKWALAAMDKGNISGIRNSWNILTKLNDPLTLDPYYKMVYHLVHGLIDKNVLNNKNLITMDRAYEMFSNQKDPERRKHILALHEEVVETFPKYVNYSSRRDAIKENLQKLKKHWKE